MNSPFGRATGGVIDWIILGGHGEADLVFLLFFTPQN
jgi:hypothetical protein